MSNALAIASVTAVLKDLLDNALIDHSISAMVGGPVLVTAVAPDLINLEDENSDRQLNIFLYHVTPNVAWRNTGLPSRDARGDRLTNPPLALDLHYLLTAYGTQDFEAEILLGYAMQLMHEMPVLTREAIRRTLSPDAPVSGVGILPPALDALSASDLADQLEQIRVTPLPLNTEEISTLWSAFQANYRPSVAYQISAVLIESTRATRSPLPVLTRGINDSGIVVQPDLTSPFPTIGSIAPPNQQISATLGDELVVTGDHLDRSANPTVLLNSPRLDAPLQLAPLAGTTTATELRVRLQLNPATDPANFVAGVYTLSIVFDRNTPQERSTNDVPFALAPSIVDPPPGSPPGTPILITAVRDGDDVVTVTVECRPEVRPTQRASLIVGDREAQAEPHPAQTNTLDFRFPVLAPGDYFVRLRVDGVESRLIDRSVAPPVFRTSQRVTIP